MDDVILDWYVGVLKQFIDHNGFPNLVDVIAVEHGWLPLEKGEVMTVHYHNNKYEIKRVDDSDRSRQ